MTSSRMLILIAAAVCVLSAGVGAADEVNVTLAGHFGGTTEAVAVSGNYTYIGQGQDLVVLDTSNPATPSELSRLSIINNSVVEDITVSGNYAYVADNLNGLVIVNVSNKAAPTLAGSYDTAGEACGVAVSGSYAYVANKWHPDYPNRGLVIVNISDPTASVLAGSYSIAGGAYDVAVSGNYAYVASGSVAYATDGSNGLAVVDISNKTAPTLAGRYDANGLAYGVAVSGNYAYLSRGSGGLLIVNVGNKAAPTLAGSYNTSGWLGWILDVAIQVTMHT